MIIGDFNTPQSPKGRLFRPKKPQQSSELNDTIDQMEIADIYRVFHIAVAQYTFLSAASGTFSQIDHLLGHKASLNKYKKTEITPCILSDHNRIQLELSNKRKWRKKNQMHGVQTPHCYTDMSSKRYGRKSKVPVIK
jgi:hypothetical protein